MNEISINLQSKANINQLRELKAGTLILLNGKIYSARDAAHKRFEDYNKKGLTLPIDLTDSVIYYMGPTPARPNYPIGSCGPTSSYRMDNYLETSLKLGIAATLGKGEREEFTKELIKKYRAPYLITIGGASAKLSECVISSKTVLFEDLLSESIVELFVKDFPAIVGIDIYGNQIFR